MTQKISIIGYGRFGELWESILRPDFEVIVFDENPQAVSRAKENGANAVSIEDALKAGTIFYAVPISSFEAVFKEHLTILNSRSDTYEVIDLLSVKIHPKNVFERYLPANATAILAHPMFGPDSVKSAGLHGQRIVLDRLNSSNDRFNFWKKYFEGKGLLPIEMSAEEHDQTAANTQGLAHYIGRILGELDFKRTQIDTLGAAQLAALKEQVCNDSWRLFLDLQGYNPFTLKMRVKLGEAQQKIFSSLIPNRINGDKLVVGIQGGRGSFNEQAAYHYLEQVRKKNFELLNFELLYLHTTERVLNALHCGEIDRGQFAMHNSLGGIVHESVAAMARYNFRIIEEFQIKITHNLMIRNDATIDDLETVMAHPQVFKQCSNNIKIRFPKLKLVSGEGDLIDHAKVAELLSKKELPKRIGTMGSLAMAKIYELNVVDTDLQDLAENYTSFLWVERS